jgi:hypothetical protein
MHTVIYFRPKLREFLRFPPNRNFGRDFVCFLKNPKFRSLKITRKIQSRSFGCWFRIESVKNLILINDRLVELWFFVLFLPCLGLELRTFWAQSQQRRPTDQAANWFERKNVDLMWYVTQWSLVSAWNRPMEITKFRIRFINFTKNETSGVMSMNRMYRWFHQKFQLNYRMFRFSERNASVAKTRNFELLCSSTN